MNVIMKSNKSQHLNLSIRFKMSIGIIFFKLVLDFIYSEYVSSIFRYEGYISNFDLERYLLSWGILMLFIPLIVSLHKKITFSSVILIIVGYLSIVPFTTMIAYYPFNLEYIWANTIYWIMLFGFYKIIPKLKLKRIKNDKTVTIILGIIIFLFLLTIVYISGRYTGFRFTLDIFNVYDLRGEASNFNLPILISYIYSATKAINPVLMIYFMHKRKNRLAVLIFFIQILSFSINGSKTVLFSTFLAVFLYWFYSKRYLYKIPWLLGVLGMISGLEVIIKGSFFLIAFIIRRVLFVPNLLSYCYFDFFSNNTPDYFHQSFLRHFGFDSEYPNIVYMIGDVYFNRPTMAANNGFISDAYANLGVIGVIVMPFIIVLAFRILDACAEGLEIKIFIVSAITMAFIFMSAFFFTILMTHGFIAVCIIIYLLPREHKSS